MDPQPPELSPDALQAVMSDQPDAPRRSQWDKTSDDAQPPPAWNRYIESRLRQFGESR